MSVKVMAWVWDHSEAKGMARLVLLAIADHADDERWSAWPSVARIAAKVKISERTVQRYLRSLEALGEVTVAAKQGGSNRYTIHPRQAVTPTGGHPDNVTGGDKRPEQPLTNRPEGATPLSPESSLEPSGNRHSLAPASPAPRDDLLDAVTQVCQLDPAELTSTALGALNKAVADLRSVDADLDEVPARAVAYRAMFPTSTLTPMALAKHWPALGTGPAADVEQADYADRIMPTRADTIALFVETYWAYDDAVVESLASSLGDDAERAVRWCRRKREQNATSVVVNTNGSAEAVPT